MHWYIPRPQGIAGPAISLTYPGRSRFLLVKCVKPYKPNNSLPRLSLYGAGTLSCEEYFKIYSACEPAMSCGLRMYRFTIFQTTFIEIAVYLCASLKQTKLKQIFKRTLSRLYIEHILCFHDYSEELALSLLYHLEIGRKKSPLTKETK